MPIAILITFFLHAGCFSSPVTADFAQPKSQTRDSAELLSHRWLVVSSERSGRKSVAAAGSMPLYMNFFSNGGFDFVGIGDGDLTIWKYEKGLVVIYHKSAPAGTPEASYHIEKLNSKTLQMSGIQAGVPVRYFLSHQPGD